MATSGRGSGVVGYNVQVAVDTEHHLIVTHAVTNSGSDRAQLASIAKQAKAVLQSETLDAVADRGYFNSPQILACQRAPRRGRRGAWSMLKWRRAAQASATRSIAKSCARRGDAKGATCCAPICAGASRLSCGSSTSSSPRSISTRHGDSQNSVRGEGGVD